MHKDYVRETYFKLKNSKICPHDDLQILKILATDEFVDYCSKFGDEKIKSISENMKMSHGYRYNSCSIRKKITENQRYAISKYLLNEFGTAKKAIAIVYNIEENQVDLTQEEINFI